MLERLGFFALLVIAVLAIASGTNKLQGQHAVWSGPYFSGAANFSLTRPLEWTVCPDQLAAYRDLTLPQQRAHRFESCDAGVPYRFNSIGFLWIAWTAKTLFPWLSDQSAAIALQLFVHLITVAIVIVLIRDRTRRVIFVVIYALNPLIIYFVQFPYEYFWTSIASLGFLVALFRPTWSVPGLVTFVVLSWILYQTRSTVIFVQLVTLALLFVRSRNLRYPLAAVVLLACSAATTYAQKSIWHTAYVGIGAYPNSYVHGLADDNAYRAFEQATGTRLNVSSPTGNYYDPRVYARYSEFLRIAYMQVAKARPLMLIRNALLNGLQSFSVGFPVGQIRYAYASALLGAVMLFCLYATRQYAILIAIGSFTVGFAAYYPPIPAYLFGAYLLLAVGAAGVIAELRLQLKALSR